MAVPILTRVLDVIARTPEMECFVEGERRSTYRDLGREMRAVASLLRPRISHGDRVALLMDSSLEYAAACYGIWLADGVVVGLNTALKAKDLAGLMEHSGATCLIADARHPEVPKLKTMLGAAAHVEEVTPGEGFDGGSAEDGLAIPEPATAQVAELIYTSGTTGHPKGVMLSHGNVAANTDSICEYLGLDARERALCVLPFYYSYGASVLHTHLVCGASLVIESSFMYPREVMSKAAAERVTSLAGVPSTFYLLMSRIDLSRYDLRSLRYVTQAGGAMDAAKIEAFCTSVPDVDFVVMYGQTEATARLSWLPPSRLAEKAGSAGKAIPGVELRIRSEADEDLPLGSVGEVCARGANVMLGYWADPEETNKVLKDGWLHTGDVGYMDEDGFVFLKGRSREMIKSGAHRIAPSEIEDVIRGVPGVMDVAVVGMDDDMLGQAVKAYVIAPEQQDGLRKQIQRTCREQLALFKVPKVVEFRGEFPRTGSGKVKKHLL